jgi:hypothetical protein
MQPDNQLPMNDQQGNDNIQQYNYAEYTPEPERVPVENEGRDEGDQELVRWQAAEYINRTKNSSWYALLALVTVILMALAIFVIKEYTFAVLIPVMAVSLVLYMKRPAPVIAYTLSRKGLHVNDKLYPFTDFREFTLMRAAPENSIILIPRKRFQLGVSFYFPEEVGEAVVDILAARLPMKESKPDAIDRFIKFLGM